MFNSDQRDHMKHLASLPPEAKCPCRWNGLHDCWNCNRRELVSRGGMILPNREDGLEYVLPDGRRATYIVLCQWLRMMHAKEHAKEKPMGPMGVFLAEGAGI